MSEMKVIGKIIQSPLVVGEIKTEIIEAKVIVLRQKLNVILYRTIYKWFAIDVDTLSSDVFGGIDEGRWK